jgi:hypothetical protein
MNKQETFAEWVGMPEFVQLKQEPYAKIVVRFETQEALEDFEEKIGQKLTKKTKSIWHPYKAHRRQVQMEFIYDEG